MHSLFCKEWWNLKQKCVTSHFTHIVHKFFLILFFPSINDYITIKATPAYKIKGFLSANKWLDVGMPNTVNSRNILLLYFGAFMMGLGQAAENVFLACNNLFIFASNTWMSHNFWWSWMWQDHLLSIDLTNYYSIWPPSHPTNYPKDCKLQLFQYSMESMPDPLPSLS